MLDHEIKEIIGILQDECKRLNVPAVTKVSQRSKNPFKVLISCILSLRTKDAVTIEASERLFKIAGSPEEIIRLSTEEIEKVIYPVGFYRVKAGNIRNISKAIIERYSGKVPDELEELLTLKGVGRKTANLVLTEGYRKDGVCVDTHVHRICNRWGYIKTKTPFDTEMTLRDKLPKRYWGIINTLLVTYGQNICKPLSPYCSICRIVSYCDRIGVRKSR
ncbi:MAG: endonuclease III domain-containing protein [Thermodesulfobacteriota bacterium]